MKFYDSFGMNPRIVRFFMLEKGIDVDREEVDIFTMENRREPYLSRNPAGQTPLLELDDGTCLAETGAICELLEEQHPEPPLIGSNMEERAIARMWWRRVEINICLPMLYGFYFGEGLEIFRERTHCIPEAAEGMKERGRKGMRWLDGLIEDGKWLAGDRFTIADICLYTYIDALRGIGQPIPDGCARLEAWFTRVGLRPAAKASVLMELEIGLTG
jgi:glutathione S-transferase